jgi:hypothetical protein
MDDFERELKLALERRPAPPSLKRRILDQRAMRRTQRLHRHTIVWQRLAAAVLVAAAIAGAYSWRQSVERRKGAEARRQVMTALRITNRALNEMNARLAAHHRDDE